ncbi:unnamed protein product, partial [marine sediment metagenome]
PRFPYVGAALCAACVATGAWLWLEFSYAWMFTPKEIEAVPWKYDHNDPWRSQHPFVGRCVRLVGISGDIWTHPDRSSYLLVHDPSDERYTARVCMSEGQSSQKVVLSSFVGRLVFRDECCGCGRSLFVAVDCATSRFTGQSVAGLVVGAMGAAVFTVALWHWLRERRAGKAQEAS